MCPLNSVTLWAQDLWAQVRVQPPKSKNGSFQMTLTLRFVGGETESQKREGTDPRSQSYWWDNGENRVEPFLGSIGNPQICLLRRIEGEDGPQESSWALQFCQLPFSGWENTQWLKHLHFKASWGKDLESRPVEKKSVPLCKFLFLKPLESRAGLLLNACQLHAWCRGSNLTSFPPVLRYGLRGMVTCLG